jgi:hypothetical protein
VFPITDYPTVFFSIIKTPVYYISPLPFIKMAFYFTGKGQAMALKKGHLIRNPAMVYIGVGPIKSPLLWVDGKL